MDRRRFLSALFRALPLAALAPGSAKARPQPALLIQESPLAGFQYHAGPRLWSELAVGQSLALVREPENRHDPRAVAVLWRTERIGYVPRMENTAVSQLLDRGESLVASIVQLAESRDPWARLRLAILRTEPRSLQ